MLPNEVEPPSESTLEEPLHIVETGLSLAQEKIPDRLGPFAGFVRNSRAAFFFEFGDDVAKVLRTVEDSTLASKAGEQLADALPEDWTIREPEWGVNALALLWVKEAYNSWAVDYTSTWLRYLRRQGVQLWDFEQINDELYGGIPLRKLAERLNRADRHDEAQFVISLTEDSRKPERKNHYDGRADLVTDEIREAIRDGKQAPRRYVHARQVLQAHRVGAIGEEKKRSLLERDKLSVGEWRSTRKQVRKAVRRRTEGQKEDVVPRIPDFPSGRSSLSDRQSEFYEHLKAKIEHGDYPEVRGQTGYLRKYAREVTDQAGEYGYGWVHRELRKVAEAYRDSEPRFAEDCRRWGMNALLMLGDFEDWYELTTPTFSRDRDGGQRHHSLHRLNLAYEQDFEVQPIDVLYGMTGHKHLSSIVKENAEEFIEHLRAAYRNESAKNGCFVERAVEELEEKGSLVERRSSKPSDTGHVSVEVALAPGHRQKVDITRRPLDHTDVAQDGVRDLVRAAENRLREDLGLPGIGKGWIQETALYERLDEAFDSQEVIHHGSPEWLGQQHFDVWIPEWDIAVEFHGKQHFEPVDHFGGEEAFEEQKRRDRRKERLAEEHGVELLVVAEGDDFDAVVDEVSDLANENG